MAGSKKKKVKGRTSAKAASTRATARKARQKAPKSGARPSAKKVVAKKGSAKKIPGRALAKKLPATKGLARTRPPMVAPRHAPAAPAARAPSPKTFAENIRDCDAGTAIWFITAGSVEHAAIKGRGSDGAVVIVTDAGVTEVVSVGNLFETADAARAARYR